MRTATLSAAVIMVIASIGESVQAAFIQQTATLDFVAVGTRDFFGTSFGIQFKPPEYQRITPSYSENFQFDKFDPALGTLNNVRLTVEIALHTAIYVAPIGTADPFGSLYPSFGDLQTYSLVNAFIQTYQKTQNVGAGTSSTDAQRGLYVQEQFILEGIYLNTVGPDVQIFDYNAQWIIPMDGQESNFIRTGQLDSKLLYSVSGGFIWHINTYYLHPGEFVAPGVVRGYPPWRELEYRRGGMYDFQASMTISYEYDYTPLRVAPEPTSFALGGLATIGLVRRSWRRRHQRKIAT